MNGKKSKLLRKQIRLLTIGKEERKLVYLNLTSDTVVNHPESTRAIYQRIKKAYKKGKL